MLAALDSKDRVTGLILAGGAGRRMGGADKGLIEYRGRPLVAHVIERLAPQVGSLLISANRNRESYAAFGHPVLADTLSDYPGPLAGLATGLATCTTPWLLCVPCDCPALPLDLVRCLHQSAMDTHAPIAVACTADGLQPTFQLCRREVLPALQAYLAAGRRKMGDWCLEQGAIPVTFSDANTFNNLNNPAQLAATR